MPRLLHLGDTHIDEHGDLEDSAQALAQVAEIAKRERVDAILWPGDVYGKDTNHRASPKEEEVVKVFLRAVAPTPTVICKGNHDAAGTLGILELAPHVTVYERPGRMAFPEFDLVILPWPEKGFIAALGLSGESGLQASQAALSDLIRGLCSTRPAPSRPLVLMGHLSVCGAVSSSGQPLVGREIQVVAGDLVDTGASAILLNHIHKPQLIPPLILYAGSLTIQDFGEAKEFKRVCLIDIGPDSRSTVRTDIRIKGREWVTIDTDASMNEEPNIYNMYASDPGLSGMNVRYRYSCDENQAHLFDHLEIKRRFAAAHSLKIDPAITRTERTRGAEVAAASGPIEKLEAFAQATGNTITDRIRQKAIEITGGV